MDQTYEEVVRCMRDKAVEFDLHLKKIQRLNADLQEKAEKTLRSVRDMVGTVKPAKKNCSVCYTRERTHALVPCGHLFCESCSERAIRSNRCFVCRSAIESSMRCFP